MSITITALNFDLTDSIKEYVEKKVQALEKFNAGILKTDVELDRNKHHKKGDVFRVRINIQIPHALLHAEETAPDLYAAIDLTQEELARQLKKQGEKMQAKRREGRNVRRSLKSIFGLGKQE